MKRLFLCLAAAGLFAAPTHATTLNVVTLTPGATIQLPSTSPGDPTSQYDRKDLPGDPDPLSIGDTIGIANSLEFHVPNRSPVQITFRGREAVDTLGFRIGGVELFNNAAAGTRIGGLTVGDLIGAQFFDPRDTGGFGLNSPTVAIASFSNTLELAFNQIGFDGDYDDMRIKLPSYPCPQRFPFW